MIEPRRTGAIISQLRKQKDWTQLQLADRLYVTHQAVSRWESGESFPDLTLLDSLAQLFDVRIDYLLYGETAPSSPVENTRPAAMPVTDSPAEAVKGNSSTGSPATLSGGGLSDVIHNLARGQTEAVAHLLDKHPDQFKNLLEAAPLTPPSLMKGVIQKMESTHIKFEHLVELAPFLDSDTLLSLLEDMDLARVTPVMIGELAPFLGKDALDRIVDRVLEGVLPVSTLEEITPFLSRTTLDRLVAAVRKEGPIGLEQLGWLAPHLSQEALHQMVAQYEAGGIALSDLAEVIPFFKRETVDALLDQAIARGEGRDDMEGLLPFISKERIQKMLNQVLDGTLDSAWLSVLAPHIDRETLNRLVRERSKNQGRAER